MPGVSSEERARIVSLYRHQVHQREIARITNRSLPTVDRICQAFHDDGRLWKLPRGPRQRVTDSEQDLLLIQAAGNAPSLRSREIKDTLNISASRSTIRRRLHEAGRGSRVPPRKPALSEAIKHGRLVFAQDHATWTAEDWRCVIFSDESTFSTRWDQRQRIWRTEKTRTAAPSTWPNQ